MLVTFGHHLNVRVALVAIDKVFEAGLRRRVVDGLGPLAGEGGAQASQLFFQMVVQTELVIDDDAAQIVDTAFHIVQPRGSAGQLIGGADVEHHKAVEIFDERLAIEVRGQ